MGANTITTAGADNALLTPRQVTARIPGRFGDKPVHPPVISRWILRGLPSRSGERVRLKATRAGGRWLISARDLNEFFEKLAAVDVPAKGHAVAAPTPGAAQERAQLACERFDQRCGRPARK